MRFWVRIVRLVAAYLCYFEPAKATDLWFGGMDSVVRKAMQSDVRSDYLDLFRMDAHWLRAAVRIQVFKTSTQFVINSPEEALRGMLGDLHRRNIVFAMEALMTPIPTRCGKGIEGYSTPGTIRGAADRIKRLGGDLRYVAMDEPLWYGHHYQGPNACRSSIADLAQSLAENVAAVHAVFPAAQIGDIEPIAASGAPDWIDQIMEFAAAYQAATGTKLAFVHADVDWNGPWQRELRQLAPRLRAAGIGFGIIYNGGPDADTDEAWTHRAEQRFEAIEADPALVPDQAILQTWELHPTHMLPETQPGTMTNLVLRYLRPITALDLQRQGGRVVGRLTEAGGLPVAGAPVRLFARDAGRAVHVTPRRLAGAVPEGTTQALIGLRVNTECDCSGAGEVDIGPVRYQQDGGAVVLRSVTAAAPPGGVRPTGHIQAVPGHPILTNTAPFPVSPGRAFSVEVPLGATPAARDSGYLAIIFLDAQGKEKRRQKIALLPSDVPLAEVTTDAAGRFVVPPAAATAAEAEIHAVYPGSERLRAAAAVAP